MKQRSIENQRYAASVREKEEWAANNRRSIVASMERNGWRPTNVRKDFSSIPVDAHDVRRATLDYYDGKLKLNAHHPWKTIIN